ncbi:MAG TPA: excinuclease ABC subunit UvrC [Halanaerobiales bacterium]|nr:excinuclease ABC subunit UvrC [Halanaerobiales bacterium]
MSEYIEEQLKQIPDKPGVYLMKDDSGEIIYVGKARSLRKRVRSYFRRGNQSYKTSIMIDHIDDFDYIVTDTEMESYILEANLIKKYHPKYNVRLKDDKTYPFIKITTYEDFPRIKKSRVVKKDGSKYFGPFADVDAIYKTINILKDLFKLRSCNYDFSVDNQLERPCLNYYIDKCTAPCVGKISKEEYRAQIDQVIMFLAGRQKTLLNKIEEEMEAAADEQNFERAARYRDAMQAVEEISRQQKVMSEDNKDRDIIAITEDGSYCVQLLLVKNGKLIGQEHFILKGTRGEDEREVMSSFLQQYYEQAPQLPDEILINTEINNREILADRLKQLKGKQVKIKIPQKGNKKRLIEMALKNAKQNLKKESIKKKYEEKRTVKAVEKLADYLELDELPSHIEGVDISNIQGTDPVASLVVFKNGRPSKSDYRRFKIRQKEGPDDFAMMKEVVHRRYRRLLEEDRKLPDLILIDGGKGQLNAALTVLEELGLADMQIIGLAKREEEVFVPNRKEPIILPKSSDALHLLQRVRDEAHRFAVNYHRKLRSRRITHSMLERIPGIGPKKKKALLQHFGSLAKIRLADRSELKEVEGISDKLAEVISDYLEKNTRSM